MSQGIVFDLITEVFFLFRDLLGRGMVLLPIIILYLCLKKTVIMDQLVIGLGEVLWDLLPERKKLGGAPANFAYHVSQFGLNSCIVSAVGKDSPGDEILEVFAARDLNYHIERVSYPTGSVQVKLDQWGSPCYEIREQVAWDHIPFTAALEDLARRTRCVCFGSLAQRCAVSRATIEHFLDCMPQGEGQYKIFDINLRQGFYTEEILRHSMCRCDILKLNEEELIKVGHMLGYSGAGMKKKCRLILQQFRLKALILTRGSQRSYVFTPACTSCIESPAIKVEDAVGAGDSFTAAFCASLLKGKSVDEAHRLAVDVSAFVCTQHGAMPVLPEALRIRLK